MLGPAQVEDAEAVTFGQALVDRMYLDTDAEAILEVRGGSASAAPA